MPSTFINLRVSNQDMVGSRECLWGQSRGVWRELFGGEPWCAGHTPRAWVKATLKGIKKMLSEGSGMNGQYVGQLGRVMGYILR